MHFPLINRAVEADAHHEAPLHAHAEGQFTYVQQGTLSVQAKNRIWAVSEQQLYWVPPGIAHASLSYGPVRFWLMAAPDALTRLLPEDICVLNASPLLVAALDRLRTCPTQAPLRAPLMAVVGHEIATTESGLPGITLPSSPRVRRWALSFIDAPDLKTGISAAAAATAMSRRSFTRHFAQETGMTFAVWQRMVIVHRAIVLLAQGKDVGDIAHQLGYDSVSAFIAMFRAAQGLSPHAFRLVTGRQAR